MTKYAVTQYDNIDDLETAIEAIDNTTNVAVINVLSYNERKYALVLGGTGNYIDGGTL